MDNRVSFCESTALPIKSKGHAIRARDVVSELGVPQWGPECEGILLFRGAMVGVPYFRKPPYLNFQTALMCDTGKSPNSDGQLLDNGCAQQEQLLRYRVHPATLRQRKK